MKHPLSRHRSLLVRVTPLWSVLAIACGFPLSSLSFIPSSSAEDDVVILDDEPTTGADSAAGAASTGDEEISISDEGSEGSGEVAVDLGAGAEDFFNPYLFDRGPIWILLPAAMLILLGLHLLPVPKLKHKKLVPMTEFFRHANPKGATSTLTSVRSSTSIPPKHAPAEAVATESGQGTPSGVTKKRDST